MNGNRIIEVKGQRLTADIRTKGSMQIIYASKCYPTSKDSQTVLMQIPRNYKVISIIKSDRYEAGYWESRGTVCSFRSLLRRGFWWSIDLPYYCYSGGEHTYRRLPLMLTLKLHKIKFAGDIRHAYRETKYSLQKMWWRRRIISPMKYYRQWQERREAEKFWKDLGV